MLCLTDEYSGRIAVVLMRRCWQLSSPYVALPGCCTLVRLPPTLQVCGREVGDWPHHLENKGCIHRTLLMSYLPDPAVRSIWLCRYVAKKSVTAATGGLQTVYALAEAAHDEFGAASKALINQVRVRAYTAIWVL
jgi:hypothetical protein